MKSFFRFVFIVIVSYIIFNLVAYYFGKAVPFGVVQGTAYFNEYYIPEKVIIYNKGKGTGELIFDDTGNNIKSKGKIPKGRIKLYYEYTPFKRNVFMDTSIADDKLEGETTAYHNNGVVWIETSYKKGKLDGPTKEYYKKKGALKREIPYDDGVIDGHLKQYYMGGPLNKDNSYQKNKLEGNSKVFYEKGVLKEEMSYRKGLLDGQYKQYYPSGKIYTVANYSKGKMIGSYAIYKEDGAVLKKGRAKSEKKIIDDLSDYLKFFAIKEALPFDGLFKNYGENTEFIREEDLTEKKESFMENQDNVLEQKITETNDNSYFANVDVSRKETKSIASYGVDDQKYDYQKSTRVIIDDDANLDVQRDRSNYNSVQRVYNDSGDTIEFHNTGGSRVVNGSGERIINNSNAGDNLANKTKNFYKTYHSNGKIFVLAEMKGNALHGITKIYYETGEIKATLTFKNGVKSGLCKTYYRNGRREFEIIFKDDFVVSKKKYSENGDLVSAW